jgi:hypothetical protein
MRRILSLSLVTATFALAGCQSHDAKVAGLQKEYDKLSTTYMHDCGAAATERGMNPVSSPAPTPQCQQEDKQQHDAWARLQAARTKQ